MKQLLRGSLVVLVAMSALTALTFGPGLNGGFIFDDYSNLILEHSWRIESLERDQLVRAVSHGEAGPLGRPLALLSFGLTYLFAGLNPYWFKLGNLLLHITNGALVFWLCRSLINIANGRAPGSSPFRAQLTASFCALAWLVHPIQVSTVMYTVQRMEIGAATGVLICLNGYLIARHNQLKGKHGAKWLVMSAAGLIVGLGFKESAILSFCFALLIELIILRFRRADGCLSKQWVFIYITSFAAASVAFVVYILPMAGADGLYAARNFNAYERLITQPAVLVMYLGQIALPLPSNFPFYFDNFPVSRSLKDPTTAASSLVILLLTAAALHCHRRWPLTTFGILWFFAGHVLTSNVIPLELAFEHRNYLPLMGIIVATIQPISELARRLRISITAQRILTAISLAALALLCAIQSATWGDPMLLAMTLEQRNPTSQRASYDLARQYLTHAGDDTSNPLWSMAKKQLELAVALPGNSTLPIQGLILLQARAEIDIPRDHWSRLQHDLTGRSLGPEGLSALYAISNCRIMERCTLDDGQLLHTFLKVLERNPESASAHTLYSNFAWNALGDRDLAITTQRRAVALSPNNPRYRIALAKFLLAHGTVEARNEAGTIISQLHNENTAGYLDDELNILESLSHDATLAQAWPSGGLERQP